MLKANFVHVRSRCTPSTIVPRTTCANKPIKNVAADVLSQEQVLDGTMRTNTKATHTGRALMSFYSYCPPKTPDNYNEESPNLNRHSEQNKERLDNAKTNAHPFRTWMITQRVTTSYQRSIRAPFEIHY
jgi:hypothetical protein